MTTLHNSIVEAFGVTPVSFRSGRYGFNSDVAKVLELLHYKVDTSITPYDNQQPYRGPDFSNYTPWPYQFAAENIHIANANGSLLEIPLSTGFLQKNFYNNNVLHKLLRKRPLSKFRIIGFLNAFGLLNKVSLNPETYTDQQMIAFAKVLRSKGFKILNLTFHSTSLKAGLSPFTKTKKDEERIFNRIKSFLQFAKNEGIESIKIMDAAEIVKD